MGRIRNSIVAAAIGLALAAQGASGQDPSTPPPPPPVTGPTEPGDGGGQTIDPLNPDSPPAVPGAPSPPKPKPAAKPKPPEDEGDAPSGGTGPKPANPQQHPGFVPIAPLTCGTTAVPASLIPIYQSASQKYHLGPTGPALLAAINEIETNFGQNQGPSYAGAIGWMQFMPATWAAYGVDADGDGDRDPSDPQDAIFAAARYLRAAGMPADPEGAIFAYNHADWYVADVLSRAACFSGVGSSLLGDLSLSPELPQLACIPARDARKIIPPAYLNAFETAAARYGLGESGVWALASVARLESNFGKGMSREQLRAAGPLGIEGSEWKTYGVDGDGDARITPQSPGDSAATLARSAWSRDGDIRAALFAHNQAAWYVDAVLRDAESLTGKCKTTTTAYAISLPGPTGFAVNWANVSLSNVLEAWDIRTGAVDPRVMALIAAISQKHTIVISSLRSDHSMHTVNGNLSNHYFGRAMDIAAIDGVSCTVVGPDSPCGRLARTLASISGPEAPTELIYCFDPDGPGPAFAARDHCDHIHAGFDS